MLNAAPSTFLKITFREADIKEALTAMALVFDCEMSVFRGRNLLFLAFEDPSVPSISAHCAMCTCAPPTTHPTTHHQSPSPSDAVFCTLCISQVL